jgi:hypothetical protein
MTSARIPRAGTASPCPTASTSSAEIATAVLPVLGSSDRPPNLSEYGARECVGSTSVIQDRGE